MNRHLTPARARGFGIVEIMVSMVIALLGMIVIFQVFAISESYNRTAVTGSDAQQNGAYSLYVLQQEIRQAGWGFNNSQALGCNVLAYNSAIGALPAYTLAPIVINAGPANGSDSLEINYGSQGLLVAPTPIAANQSSSLDPFPVANPFGFNLGDTVLAVEAGEVLHSRADHQATPAHGRGSAPMRRRLQLRHPQRGCQRIPLQQSGGFRRDVFVQRPSLRPRTDAHARRVQRHQ